MSRRRKQLERVILPNPKYKNVVLSKFINSVMLEGKKSLAEKIVYGALDILAEKTGKDPLEVFLEALDNSKPLIKIVSRRIGGANYQVPIPVDAKRQQALAFR